MNLRAFHLHARGAGLRASLAALLVLPLACVDAPPRAEATAAKSEPEPEAPAKTAAAEPGSLELSAEELELLAADPKTLSPEQNRKRAFALRKKVMQDPDSPQAQSLEEARAAVLNGELPIEQITAETLAPPPNPGLVIELPEHLKQPPKSE